MDHQINVGEEALYQMLYMKSRSKGVYEEEYEKKKKKKKKKKWKKREEDARCVCVCVCPLWKKMVKCQRGKDVVRKGKSFDTNWLL